MTDDVSSVSAQSVTLSTLLGGDHRFEVPDYQRQYSWEKEQWETFWRDIQNIDEQKDRHFLGSVLLISLDTGFGQRDVYEVVDGQQRLATVSILFAVIRERLRGDVPNSTVEGINKYLIDEDQDGNKEQNLKLNTLDNDTFQQIINGNGVSNEESKLWQAAEYYADKIQKLSISEIKNIRDKVLQAMPIVLIETYDEDSAFLLFETLNDRGLELSNVDLMKNTLLEAADAGNVDYESVRENWENTVSELRYDVDQYEKFFQHYLMFSPIFDINDSISERTVLDYFEGVVGNIDEYEISGIEAFTEDIYKKARIYRNVVNASISKYTDSANSKINDILSRLRNFGSTQERILMLYIFTRIDNESSIIRALLIVESYDVRKGLASDETGSTVTQFYSTTCSTLAQSDHQVDVLQSELVTRAPSDDDFETAMMRKTFARSDRTRYILTRYEQTLMSGDQESEGQIEHIAPRSAFTANKYTSWTTYLDVGKDEFEELKDMIGNLTLMESSLNIEAGNDPFSDKKEKYKQSNFEMAQSISQHTDWSKEKIQERTEKMAQEAPDIWHFDH